MSVPSEWTLRRVATFLATFGVGVATYIAVENAGGDAPACIAGGSGCATVTKSSYSEVAGINVAILGIVGYVMLLGAAVMRGDGARLLGFAVALAGFGFSIYLTSISVFEIEAVCQWCVASATLMTLLFAVNTTRMLTYAGRPS